MKHTKAYTVNTQSIPIVFLQQRRDQISTPSSSSTASPPSQASPSLTHSLTLCLLVSAACWCPQPKQYTLEKSPVERAYLKLVLPEWRKSVLLVARLSEQVKKTSSLCKYWQEVALASCIPLLAGSGCVFRHWKPNQRYCSAIHPEWLACHQPAAAPCWVKQPQWWVNCMCVCAVAHQQLQQQQ